MEDLPPAYMLGGFANILQHQSCPMSESANTHVHIPRPKVWQAFEAGSVYLWRKILKDPSLHRFGRNGQAQYGMDMFGYRDGDAAKIVGIQCKCKGPNEQASEGEFRADFAKALKYEPRLTEYYFTTTADDDVKLHKLAATLTDEQRKLGRNIIVRAWGWGTLEDAISSYPEVALVFDPNHSPTAKLQSQRHEELTVLIRDSNREILAAVSAIQSNGSGRSVGDATSSVPDLAEVALDREIDRYRDRANSGKPLSALDLLQNLLRTLSAQNSGHIWFRVKANIAHCHLALGDEVAAANVLEEAIAHAPDDPKAAANIVLVMILRGKHKEAWQRALLELEKAPENDALAGYAVQAAGLAGISDDLSHIPEPLLKTDAVQKFHLQNLRNAGDLGWRELARQGRETNADDEFFRRQAADADIESVVEGDHKSTWVLRPEDWTLLRRAADDLSALWIQAKEEEAPDRPDKLALCINGALALLILGEAAEAKSLILDGLAVSKGKDPDLIIRVGAIALEIGDRALAEETFPKLDEDGVALQLKCQIAATYRNWDYLASLADSQKIDTLPEPERNLIKALTSSARIRVLAKSDPAAAETQLNLLAGTYSASGRASVVIAQLADELGLSDTSNTAYRNAIRAIGADSHIASRTMVANYAARRHDHAAIISLLDGFLDKSRDSPELLNLARAFSYEFPPRAGAVAFFETLPDNIRQSERYILLEGLMHYHRGKLDLAEKNFAKARELTPDQVRPILMQVQTLLRLKRKDELPELVRELDPGVLKGAPEDLMDFAQILAANGRVNDALRLGFETLEVNLNDPRVSLKWLGLCLGHLHLLHELSDAPVGVGMWAKLIADDGHTDEFLVVDGPGAPAQKKYATSHAIAMAAIGRRSGEVFQHEDMMGRKRAWTVEAVFHKYLHAYEDLTEHFNTRFPEESGFFVVRTSGDDIEPFLDIMRHQGEQRQRILDLYSKGSLPISAIAEFAGSDVVRLADSLRTAGIDIDTCSGTYSERAQAIQLVEERQGKGVVLDTLTFWSVVGIDGLATLKKVFGSVLVARTTADEIGRLIDEKLLIEGSEKKGMAYFHDGKFYLDESTPERERAIADAVAKREKALENDCEVVPVHAPDDFDHRLTEHFHRGTLDPIFVASERNVPLVSEDKRFRQWAAGQEVPSVWLQAVFIYAHTKSLIDDLEYARLSAELSWLRHRSVTCNASVLVQIVRGLTPETRYRMHAIADAIGTRDAEIDSHVNVALWAIERLWSERPVSLDAQYMTGLLIQNLIRYRHHLRDAILNRVFRTLARFIGGADYFREWKSGHFILDSPPLSDEPLFRRDEHNLSGTTRKTQKRVRRRQRRS